MSGEVERFEDVYPTAYTRDVYLEENQGSVPLDQEQEVEENEVEENEESEVNEEKSTGDAFNFGD